MTVTAPPPEGPRRTRTRAWWGGVAVLCALAAGAGCGYRFADGDWALALEVRTLRVGAIANETRQFGLEKSLAFALEREIMRWGAVALVEQPGGADAVLGGTIRDFTVVPVAFDARDEALQYETAVVLDLHLTRSRDGSVLWEVAGLRVSEEFSSVARIVVTSSSRFQRNTLNAADLPKLTDIQLAESNKELAVERLLESLARDAYALMAANF